MSLADDITAAIDADNAAAEAAELASLAAQAATVPTVVIPADSPALTPVGPVTVEVRQTMGHLPWVAVHPFGGAYCRTREAANLAAEQMADALAADGREVTLVLG